MDYSKKISEKERRVKCQKQIHASSLLCGIHLVAKVVPAQAHSVVGCCFFFGLICWKTAGNFAESHDKLPQQLRDFQFAVYIDG